MTAARLFSVSGFVVMGGAVVLAAAMSNCGGSGGERTGGAGNTGQGGSGGSAGAAGTGNTGGRFMCADSRRDASTARGAPLTLPTGHVTNLSMREWSADRRQVLQRGRPARLRVQLLGARSDVDSGVNISSNSHGVDAPAGNFRLIADGRPRRLRRRRHLVRQLRQRDVVQRAALLGVGCQRRLTGCTFKVQLQTFEQRPDVAGPARPVRHGRRQLLRRSRRRRTWPR